MSDDRQPDASDRDTTNDGGPSDRDAIAGEEVDGIDDDRDVGGDPVDSERVDGGSPDAGGDDDPSGDSRDSDDATASANDATRGPQASADEGRVTGGEATSRAGSPRRRGAPSERAALLVATLAALAVIFAGLVQLWLGLLPIPPLMSFAAVSAGTLAGAAIHQRLRGVVPARWVAAALLGALVVLVLDNPMYTRAGAFIAGAAGSGLLMQAWRRPIDTIVALGGLLAAIAGHIGLHFAATRPGGGPEDEILKITLLFGAAGSLVVGTSSTIVWCRQNLPQALQASPRRVALAWLAMLASLGCAAFLAWQRVLPLPLQAVWIAAAAAHVGALLALFGRVLAIERQDELDP